MKKTEEELFKQYRAADFDTDPLRKHRVYAKASLPSRRTPRFGLVYASAASLVLIIGLFAAINGSLPFDTERGVTTCSIIETDKQQIIVSSQVKPQASNTPQALTEEDCAEVNTRYLIAQAASQQSILLARVKDCPTAQDPISSYDTKIIAAMEREMHTYSQVIFTQNDMNKLQACSSKYNSKLHPVMLYRMEC